MSPLETIKQIYAAYGQGDFDTALGHCTEDVCFRWPIDAAISRLAGNATGKPAFLERIHELHRSFEFHAFNPVSMIADGDRVAAQVEMEVTQRATGKRLKLENAHFWTVKDGKAVELVEYYDTAAIVAAEAG